MRPGSPVVPSAWQLKYNDKRAKAGGKIAAKRCFSDADRFVRLSDDTAVMLPLAA